MFLVGLTGGIATGKSTVSKIFQEHNVPVIDADKIAFSVLEPGKPAYIKLVNEFGVNILVADGGAVDREKLGKMVFSDIKVRQKVNKITHPLIRQEIWRQMWKHFLSGANFVLLDLPLLFEAGYENILQKIIVVTCTEEQQLSRLRVRNNLDEETAMSRILAQLPLEEKIRRATYVVNNSGNMELTRAQTEAIILELKSSKLHWIIRGALFGIAVLFMTAAIKLASIIL